MRPIPEMNRADMAFGCLAHLPPIDEIPDEFKNMNNETKWNKIVSRWFFAGLPPDTEVFPKDGVDPSKALRAVGAILRSFAPKHEHKEAGCAFLLSEWFEDIKIPEVKRES